METLIISAPIINPPTESLAFYYLTMTTKRQLNFSNLLEVDKEEKDIYYKYIKRLRIHDFVDQLVTPEEFELGIRIDTDHNFPLTVIADRISFRNVTSLLGQIKYLNSL